MEGTKEILFASALIGERPRRKLGGRSWTDMGKGCILLYPTNHGFTRNRTMFDCIGKHHAALAPV